MPGEAGYYWGQFLAGHAQFVVKGLNRLGGEKVKILLLGDGPQATHIHGSGAEEQAAFALAITGGTVLAKKEKTEK